MRNWETHNNYIIVTLSIIYVIFAKLGASPNMSLGLTLPPIIISVIGLTLLSPPVGAALVFMSHNLIGQITMNHPGFLVQVFPAFSLVGTLLYVRRSEFLSARASYKIQHPETWGLIALGLILFFAFCHAVFLQSGLFSAGVFTNLFKASHGGNFSYYPYVFASRWSLFIIIGALCCRGLSELKVFFIALAIFVVTQLMAIPFDHYQWVFSDMCANRLNYTGFQALNVNRAYLGYLLACSSYISLTFALQEAKRSHSIFYYIGSFILLFLCIVAGSKGPVLAAFIAFLFLFLISRKKWMIQIIAFGAVFISLSLGLPRLFGCAGGLQNIIKSSVATTKSSVSVRADLAQAEYKKTTDRNLFRTFFGGGLGASLSTTESTFINPHDKKPITVKSSSGSHNLFLDFLIDLGIVGLTGFLLSLLLLVYFFFKGLQNSPERLFFSAIMGGEYY